MGGKNQAAFLSAVGLRLIKPGEAKLFAQWESNERPYPWSESVFPLDTWVLDDQDRVAGYAVVKIVGDEAHLSNLMIDPGRRSMGLGRALMQKVMMSASKAGAKQIILDVDPANTPAVGLYQDLGFELLERRKNSYPRGEDALVMQKNL